MRTILLSLAVSICIVIWSLIEPYTLRITETKIQFSSYSPSCQSFRVAFLTDLHIGSPGMGLNKLTEIVDLVKKFKVDLILFGGDYTVDKVIGGDPIGIEQISNRLTSLDCNENCFSVLGNHDYHHGKKAVIDALTKSNIITLVNEDRIIVANECKVLLYGMDDLWEGKPMISYVQQPNKKELNLILAHNPDVFKLSEIKNSVMLAGHTHGGQVNLPFIGELIVPSMFGNSLASGIITDDTRVLYVGTGLGTSILGVRFNVTPSVDILTFEALSH